jgi:hypothetical protein
MSRTTGSALTPAPPDGTPVPLDNLSLEPIIPSKVFDRVKSDLSSEVAE